MKNLLKKILAARQLQEGVAWHRRNYDAGTVIVKKGDIGESLFYIEKGVLRVTGDVQVKNQKTIQAGVCDLESGSIFGEICLHQSQIRTATVTAASDVELLEIEGEAFSVYLDDNPVLGYLFYKNLFEIMINRLGMANRRIENLTAWGLKVQGIDSDF